MSEAFDRLSDATVAKIAENGRAYTNEVKHMARELQELRREKAEREAATLMAPYTPPYWPAP